MAWPIKTEAASTLRRRNFKKGALILRLGLPSTLIRHENGASENALQTVGIWKPVGFAFSCGRKTFWKRSFRKRWRRSVDGDCLTTCDGRWNKLHAQKQITPAEVVSQAPLIHIKCFQILENSRSNYIVLTSLCQIPERLFASLYSSDPVD